MKSICIITSRYPNENDKTAMAFVQQFVWELAEKDIDCTVICPIPININVKDGMSIPYETKEKTSTNREIRIFSPKYIGFGQRDLKIFKTAQLTIFGFHKAVEKVFKKLHQKPDGVYGHFITPSGITAARIGKLFNIPSFLSYGESSPWSIYNLGVDKVKKELKDINGVIAVSTKNKEELMSLKVVDEHKIKVFPNAIRETHFYPRDKNESRKLFGLPEDVFIVCFVGHFIKRKGIDYVVQAVEEIGGVYGIYAGKGQKAPSGNSNKNLYTGLVPHEELPWFYSAADVFVLPTLNEGCCNAIIEAMACGLPIISSNKSFNDDILDESNSIRIDSENILDIKNAILELQHDKNKLGFLQEGSLEKAKQLTLNIRASKIIGYMNNKSKKN